MILKKNHVSWREIKWIFNLLTSDYEVISRKIVYLIVFSVQSMSESIKILPPNWNIISNVTNIEFSVYYFFMGFWTWLFQILDDACNT